MKAPCSPAAARPPGRLRGVLAPLAGAQSGLASVQAEPGELCGEWEKPTSCRSPTQPQSPTLLSATSESFRRGGNALVGRSRPLDALRVSSLAVKTIASSSFNDAGSFVAELEALSSCDPTLCPAHLALHSQPTLGSVSLSRLLRLSCILTPDEHAVYKTC